MDGRWGCAVGAPAWLTVRHSVCSGFDGHGLRTAHIRRSRALPRACASWVLSSATSMGPPARHKHGATGSCFERVAPRAGRHARATFLHHLSGVSSDDLGARGRARSAGLIALTPTVLAVQASTKSSVVENAVEDGEEGVWIAQAVELQGQSIAQVMPGEAAAQGRVADRSSAVDAVPSGAQLPCSAGPRAVAHRATRVAFDVQPGQPVFGVGGGHVLPSRAGALTHIGR